jgi:hypothetical protein
MGDEEPLTGPEIGLEITRMPPGTRLHGIAMQMLIDQGLVTGGDQSFRGRSK